jgi:4-aminobutyrate aminotransferase-like enzyme
LGFFHLAVQSVTVEHREIDVNAKPPSDLTRVKLHHKAMNLPIEPPSSLLARRRDRLGPAYRLFYDRPLHIVEGEGVWLTDSDGQRYLDAYNNVPHVGHCHPWVVEAIATQAATLNTHTRYLHENIVALSERLAARTPPGLEQVMYGCSGTEANDLALRIARAVTGNEGVIVTEHAYHGHSCAILPLSTEDTPPERRGDHVVTVPAPDRYRCPVGADAAATHYAAALDEAIATLVERGHRPAAFFLDTVLSSEGIPTVPEGYLATAAERVRAAGGLFVADEVQAGYGRSGTHFWGFDRLGAMPDLVTLGKPMGNGHPISAVIARPELLETFSRENHYFNTFGGNPVSCAAALAVLDVMDEEGLMGNAGAMGDRLLKGLRALADQFEAIGDVRGTGLFLGLELVSDRDTKAPDGDLAHRVINGLRDAGILVGRTGPGNNVIKIRPPMVLSASDSDLLLGALAEVLETVTSASA